MANRYRLLKVDYLNLNTPSKEDRCTLLEIVGQRGECMVKSVKVDDLGFIPSWYPCSVQGYHQAADLPVSGFLPNMSNATLKWSWIIPENGAIMFFDTENERTKMMNGDM